MCGGSETMQYSASGKISNTYGSMWIACVSYCKVKQNVCCVWVCVCVCGLGGGEGRAEQEVTREGEYEQ